MVAAGAFDGDQQVFEAVFTDGFAKLVQRGLERRPVAVDSG